MTPEQAILRARRIAKRYRRHSDEVESGALLGYVQACRSWRPNGLASLTTHAKRRMEGAAIDALREATRHRSGRRVPALIGVGAYVPARAHEPRSEPMPLLRKIAARLSVARTSRGRGISDPWAYARVAWLVWGLGYTGREVARALGVGRPRVWQMLVEVRKVMAA